VQVLVPIDEYVAEDRGFDGSTDEGYSIKLTAKWLADKMRLTWRGDEGRFYDPSETLVAFDPSLEPPACRLPR
jgi:hypothetical protein